VQAGVRSEFRKSGGRALLRSHAEEGLRIPGVGPAEAGTPEEGQLLVETVASQRVEMHQRSLAAVEDVGERARAQQEPALRVGTAESCGRRALDVAQPLQPRI